MIFPKTNYFHGIFFVLINISFCRLIRSEFPASWAWVKKFEDLSGVEAGQHCDNTQYLQDVLQFASDVYLPFLAANHQALLEDKKTVEVTLWPHSSPLLHSQPAFKYQEKCYQRIRQSFSSLPQDAQEKLVDMMSHSSCLRYIRD